MKKLTSFLLSGCLAMLLAGCAYHVKVPQGNVLSQAAINQLKPGLTEYQVEYLLGSPLINSLQPNTFDYIDVVDKDNVQTAHLLVINFGTNGELINYTLSAPINKPGFAVEGPEAALNSVTNN